MKERYTWFGQFINLGGGIAEVIINEGVEIDVAKVEVLRKILADMDPPARYLLANRKNRYSFSFQAGLKIASLKDIRYVAILKHRPITYIPPRALQINLAGLAVFDNRQKALEWLNKKRLEENRKLERTN